MGSWWVGQQLARLAESSNVDCCMLGQYVASVVHSFHYFHLPRPSLPPCCRFYELPWALIHLCHTQAPLLWLLTNWSGCRCEGPAGHIRFLQPGQRPASLSAKIWGHLGVGKTCSARLLSKWAECENLLVLGVWVGWRLRKYLNWFGHWEFKAVDLNMKDMIIQWPSGLLVSCDWINNGRNLKTHMGRIVKRVKKEAKV